MASHTGAARRLRASVARHENLIWIVAMVALLTWRWPVIKGYYYKVADIPAPATAIAWRSHLDEALIEAQRTGRHVVVDFSADWCPPCLAMTHDVWPDARVAELVSRSYIPVLIDVDRDGVTTTRYQVRGIPTVLILDDAGTVIRRGAPLTAGAMISFLETPGTSHR
jgi:thiol:disulfide interchange protein